MVSCVRRVLPTTTMKRKQVESESETEDEVKEEEDEGMGDEQADDETEEIDEDGNVIRRRAIERPTFVRGDDG